MVGAGGGQGCCSVKGFSGGPAGKESTCNVGDLGLIPGLERSRRREWLSTPVFWPGEFHVLYSPWGHKESDMTKLSKILILLSANGWGCVPSLLVVWPEMTQHWNLQVVYWG